MVVRLRAQTNPKGRGRGDFVDIVEDDHVFGSREGLPDYCVLEFPGVSVATIRRFLETDYDPATTGLFETVRGVQIPLPPQIRRKCRRRLQINDLTAGQRNRLVNTQGRLVVGPGGDITRLRFLQIVRRLDDNRTAEEEGIAL